MTHFAIVFCLRFSTGTAKASFKLKASPVLILNIEESDRIFRNFIVNCDTLRDLFLFQLFYCVLHKLVLAESSAGSIGSD